MNDEDNAPVLSPLVRSKRRRYWHWSNPVPLCIIGATILGSAIVSWIIGTIEFFYVITLPLAVTGMFTYWFRSWTPVMVVAISNLYFMLFWLVGVLGDLADRTFAQAISEAMGIDHTVVRFGAYIGVWIGFVMACEAGLNKLIRKKEADPTVALPLE